MFQKQGQSSHSTSCVIDRINVSLTETRLMAELLKVSLVSVAVHLRTQAISNFIPSFTSCTVRPPRNATDRDLRRAGGPGRKCVAP